MVKKPEAHAPGFYAGHNGCMGSTARAPTIALGDISTIPSVSAVLLAMWLYLIGSLVMLPCEIVGLKRRSEDPSEVSDAAATCLSWRALSDHCTVARSGPKFRRLLCGASGRSPMTANDPKLPFATVAIGRLLPSV